jgi:hypothetical protein
MVGYRAGSRMFRCVPRIHSSDPRRLSEPALPSVDVSKGRDSEVRPVQAASVLWSKNADHCCRDGDIFGGDNRTESNKFRRVTDPTNGSKAEEEGPQEEDPSRRKQGNNAGIPASKASTKLRRDRLRVKREQSIEDGKMLSALSATYTEHNSSSGSSGSCDTSPEAGHGIKSERNGSISSRHK